MVRIHILKQNLAKNKESGKNALPVFQVVNEEGQAFLAYSVSIDGPCELVSDIDGHPTLHGVTAWVQTDSSIFAVKE